MMLPFATVTGTGLNLAEMKKHGIGLLLEPRLAHKPWAVRAATSWPHGVILDVGSWGCFTEGRALRWLDVLNMWAAWGRGLRGRRGRREVAAVILPDIVCGGAESWAMSMACAPLAAEMFPGATILAPVQPGTPKAWLERWGAGFFVGGRTEQDKVGLTSTLRRMHPDAWIHVGRVNTMGRIAAIKIAGADSFDGTSATRYSSTAGPIAAWAATPRQLDLEGAAGLEALLGGIV